jgi:diguanylate cyclase (GGDEF)-like protein
VSTRTTVDESVDEDLRRRSVDIRRTLCVREAPWVLLLFAVIIVVFDVGFALIGVIPPLGYYVSDAIQGVWNVVTAVLIMRGVITRAWAPAAVALAICVNNAVLNYQYTVVGYSAVGVILLTMAVYGSITLMWRPFLISAVWMGSLTSIVLITQDPENGLGWTLTALTALLVSGVVLFGRVRAVLPLARANRTIEELATSDALTGVLNRHGLDISSTVLVPMAERAGQPLFAVFLDISGLKRANDTYGHAFGDRVIMATAEALRTHCRESDLLCRWGGDEFVIVGLGQAPDVEQFSRRVVNTIDAAEFAAAWVPHFHVGAAQSDARDLQGLIRAADTAMYARRHQTGD